MKLIFVLLLLAFICNVRSQVKFLSDPEGCWLQAYGRGVGKPIHTCRKGEEKNGLLCYPLCQDGFTGVGPVCWQNCPDNFRDDGVACYKPQAYGRGVGYPLTELEKCQSENPIGCEQWGGLYYPKCKAGYHNVACCICSPDCPSGMTDIGISCAKQSYGRGAGTTLTCSEEEDYDTGLCYPFCPNEFKPVGPVCWGKCPKGYNECGALCIKGTDCAGKIKEYFEEVIEIIEAIAKESWIEGFIDISKFIKDFIYPICKP